jgi:dihydrolipoamide dehydrogenase
MEKFDLCVIGAGPSGYAAAMRAIDLGKKIVMIERDKIGGAGIFNGALSSKTLWELSENYKITRTLNMGFTVYDSSLSYHSVISEMHRATEEKYSQLKEQVDLLQHKGKLTFIKGSAKMLSKNEVEITLPDGSQKIIFADYTILAIGSRPRYLPNIPIDEKIIVTSDGISSFDDFPKSIVILGAGVIGCEFATVFSNFGRTKVYLIDKQSRILPFEDEDLSYTVAANLQENGVTIHKGSQFLGMKIVEGMVEYKIQTPEGIEETYTVEKALISVGRVANSENIGLNEIGVELTPQGNAVDEDAQTTIPNIYAVGDFTADIALVNIAEMEGRYAVERIFNIGDRVLTYNNISTIMFLNPEVAGVGLSELKAKESKIPYKVAVLKYKFISRAIAMRKPQGFIKILVTDDDEMKILGMRVCGSHASSTIQAVSLMIAFNRSIRDLVELIHPHPSITEGVQECARMLCGKSIIKPDVFNMHVKCHRVTSEGRVEDLWV